MVLPGEISMPRSIRWLLATAIMAVGSASTAYAQSCNITYQWPTWVGGNGFGASIDIRNTGPAITNGWSLVFNFPNGQQLQNGWPVSVTQSGTTLTAASNAAWNQSIPSNGVFQVAFNGTFNGTNNPPTAFTLNGTACTIGNTGNTPPTVSVTSPTANQNFAANTAIPLAATAADPGGAVVRVDFRLDGSTTVVGSDTTSPYTFSVPAGLATGSHTVTATAVDNGSPALSTTSAAVTFTVGGGGNTPPTASVTSPTANQSFAAGAAIPLAATATDPGGAVVRVDFRLDGSTTVVGSDTTSPYTFAANGVAAGSHTVTATAVDNGSPALSTTSAPVSFTVGAQGAVFRVNPQGRITKNGTVFPVRCGSWFGLEGRHEPSDDPVNPSGAAMEQYIGNTSWVNGGQGSGRTIAQTMTEIAGMGINVIRLPLVPQTLNASDPQGTGNVLKNHSSVRIANSRLALETMIRAADTANIEVMLDIHSCSNFVGWRKGRFDARPPWVDADRDNYDFKRENYSCAASGNPSTVTTTHPYSASQWLQTLTTVAGLGTSLGVDNIIGIDIYNEPHDYTWAEWKGFTEQAYTAINAVNPNTLLFVQGVGTNAGTQDGTPTTVTPVPHGSTDTNPNWGENLFEAGGDPPNVPRDRLVYSPHTYGPSVFVQKMFMDPAQTACAGLEGDAAGDLDCRIVINPTLLRQGWEEHFGYLRQMGYAIVVGEFGGNMDWPLGQASIRDRNRWSHITPGVDTQWQDTFVTWMIEKGIEGCYWSINPESGDTAGWYGHAYDPISNESGWGEWRPFDQRKTNLLNRLWGR